MQALDRDALDEIRLPGAVDDALAQRREGDLGKEGEDVDAHSAAGFYPRTGAKERESCGFRVPLVTVRRR